MVATLVVSSVAVRVADAYDPCVANETAPPRPIAVGNIVATYSDDLGEWTAAQITDLEPNWKTAGMLELDWSGPEPSSVADLGAHEAAGPHAPRPHRSPVAHQLRLVVAAWIQADRQCRPPL